MNDLLTFLTMAISVTCSITDLTAGDAVTYFRHDHGVAGDEHKLPDDLAKEGNLVWRSALAPGNSTPCVVGNRVVLTTYVAESKTLTTVSIDRATGKPIWKRIAETKQIERYHTVGSPATCTIASDGRRLFSFFGSYGMLCYDLDGKLLWKRRMGPFQDEFGASSSPIFVDGKIIINQDHDIDNFVMAVDPATGDTLWKTKRPRSTRSYATPIVWRNDDDVFVVVAGSLQLSAYNVKDGKLTWWVDGLSRIVDSTPVLANNRIYLATWTPGGDQTERIAMEPYADALESYDKNNDGFIAKAELPQGAVLARFFRIDLNQDQKLNETEWMAHARIFEKAQNAAMRIRPGGKGNVTGSQVDWIHRRGLPTVPSSVVYRGIMYMVKDSGILTTLDAKTGERIKQMRLPGRGSYYASLVAGDGKIFIVSERGVISVLKAGRESEVLSSHDFGERILATPAIVDGHIYLRTDAALYCFGRPRD